MLRIVRSRRGSERSEGVSAPEIVAEFIVPLHYGRISCDTSAAFLFRKKHPAARGGALDPTTIMPTSRFAIPVAVVTHPLADARGYNHQIEAGFGVWDPPGKT